MSTSLSEPPVRSEPSIRPLAASAIIVVVLCLAIRLSFILQFNLFVDEAIYVFIAEHSPLTFTPHPPGVPWLVHLGTTLLGQREIGVRLMSLALGALFPLAAWILARQLVSARAALWSVILLSLIPSYNAFGALATPDMPQLFLWTCMLGLAWQALTTGRLSWWIGAGAVAAVALAVKYVAVLFFPALALYLILSGQWRRHLRQPGVYLMCLVTAILMCGLIAIVGAETFIDGMRYHASERQTFRLESLKDVILYYAAHLVYFSPLTYVLAVCGMIWAGVRGWKLKNPQLLFLFSFAVTPFLFFGLISLVTARVLNREHWDSIAYVTAVIAGIAWVHTAWPHHRARALLLTAASLGAVTLLVAFLEAATALPSRLVGQRPAFSSLKGWDQLSEKIDQQMDALPPGSFILMSSFPLMVEHDFYSRRNDPIYTVPSNRDERYGIGIVWNNSKVSQKHLGREQGHDGLFVNCDRSKNDVSPKRVKKWTQNLHYRFESIDYLGNGQITDKGRIIRHYFFLHGHALKEQSLWLQQPD